MTAPLKDSQVWSSPQKWRFPSYAQLGCFGIKMMIWRSRQDQDNKEKQELYFYFLFLDILSKLDIRSRAMGLSHTHLLVRFMASKRFSNSNSNLVLKRTYFENKFLERK